MTPTASYDVIVVGSRCAGAPTAMLLARRGHRVLLVDRATMPSDTLSTHNLVPSGMVMLRKWGVLEALTATGCPAAVRTRVTLGDTTFEVPIDEVAGITTTFAPRRSVIDGLLTDAARDAGVDVRLETSVQRLLWRGDRVEGISARGRTGEMVEAHAPLVVGADGVNSFVARATGAAPYRRRGADNCVYYAYWHGVPEPDTLEVALVPGRAMAIFPTHDGNACVLAARSGGEWDQYRRQPEAEYLASFAAVPAFGARVREGSRVSRFFGTADLPNFFRPASGPGWALVGDAGLVKDPGPGRGMSDAFRQADKLAAAIDDGLRGGQDMDAALASYGAWRDNTFAGVFETTVDLARYDWTLDEVSLRFLRHQQAIAAEHELLAAEEASLI
jgi:2-polyprenyl-6-methoxyphenol hydroxylase-like FAD-dependent oxidoreductase